MALLVYDTPRTLGPDHVFAYDEDPVFEAMEWASLNQVSFTQDPEEPHDCLLVLATPDWKRSRMITKRVVLAQRIKKPIYFYRSGKVTRSR